MKRNILILSSLAILCSCTAYIEANEELEQDGDVVHAFKASVLGNEQEYEDTAFTKGVISSSDMTFTWSEGDYVGVWAEESDLFEGGSTRVIFKSKTGGSSTTTFIGNGWGLLRGNSYYAHYPYAQSQSSTEVALSWAEQEQIANADASHLASHAYYHTYYSVPETGEVALSFSPIGAIVKFNATLPADLENAFFTELTVSSDEDLFTSSAVYNPSSEVVVLEPTKVSSMTLLLNGSEGIQPNEGVLTMLMAMAPTEYSEKTLTFVLTDAEGETYKATKQPKTNLNPGDRRTYSLSFVSEKPIVFEDSNVKAICVSLWDTNGDGELSYSEAAAVTEIPYDAFNGNKTITSFNEFQYFVNCTTLRSQRETTSDDTDFNGAFEGCTALTSIVLPSSLRTIGYSAFAGCTSLGSITIPASVTQIRDLAFVGDPQLEVHMESATPVALTKHTNSNPYYYAFGYTGQKVKTIFVPTEAAETAYKASTYYEFYKLIIHVEGWAPKPTYEYVDLGLSVKWATMNIGAGAPKEYGDYFAWGATESWHEEGYGQESPQTHWKSGYEGGYIWNNTPFQAANSPSGAGYTKWTKYIGNSESSYQDISASYYDVIKTVLEPNDDAASCNIGRNWRIPTESEWQELIDKCTWTWTTQEGVDGYLIRSNVDGYSANSIFLPASGSRYDTNAQSSSYYWSSSASSSSPYAAKSLNIYSGAKRLTDSPKHYGLAIRPVYSDDSKSGITGLSLDRTSLTFNKIWDGTKLVATIESNPNAVNKDIIWMSSDPKVVTVNNNGYVRAISNGSAVVSAVTIFGGYTATCSVTVNQYFNPDPDANGHDYVDLGLSVKWATMNIGSKSMTDYGYYIAWGATETWYNQMYTPGRYWKTGKDDGYAWSVTPYQTNENGGDSTVLFAKYLGSTSSPYKDPVADDADAMKTCLDLDDDAAHVIWQGDWRMPSYTEWDELMKNCSWVWTTMNGYKGFKITSNKTGYTDKWIFLPAGGHFIGNNDSYNATSYDTNLLYWSSSLVESDPRKAYHLSCTLGGVIRVNSRDRKVGLPIRPVIE